MTKFLGKNLIINNNKSNKYQENYIYVILYKYVVVFSVL